MLIRWATDGDISAWEALSREYDAYVLQIMSDLGQWYRGFADYMRRKIVHYEAVIAIERMTGRCNGVIAFSRTHNRITFFGISQAANHRQTAERLLRVALRQLNSNEAIAINLPDGEVEPLAVDRQFFSENGFAFVKKSVNDGCPMAELVRKGDNNPRGKSFHYRYPKFIKSAQREFCPCTIEPESGEMADDILKNDCFWVRGEYPGQGRLFGKLCVIPMVHYFHFEEMPSEAAIDFMKEVQRVGRALKIVTGAEKINYEMHANTGAHLHIHLFPRYLDDDFPSAPIDYRLTEPAPYESYDEYLWFVSRMRTELEEA